MNVLVSFYTLLYSIRVRREGEDKLWWAPSHKGKFDVRSFYKFHACKDDVPFPWKSIWRTKVPLKLTFFVWSAALGKILSMDFLGKKHVIEVAWALWNVVFSRFGLSWVMPHRDALGVLWCGRWCLLAFCSTCGGNKMIEISRTKKRR
jgi:hypothetical protein